MTATTIVSIRFLLELFAKAHVKRTEDKKHDDNSGKDEIAHKPDDGADLSGSVN